MNAKVLIVSKTPQASFVLLTPTLVDSLLAINEANRKVRLQKVEHYRRQIQRNEWVLTNQGIGVSASGFLVDGQHRLLALKAEGYPPITMLLVTGLPDQAIAAVDTGANRNARDYLALLFKTNLSNTVTAVLRTSMMADLGFVGSPTFTPTEYASKFEQIGDSINAVFGVSRAGRVNSGVLAALVDAHYKGYHEETLAFTEAFTSGEMLEKGNPALTFRNWLNAAPKRGGNAGVIELYRKTCAALQAWIDGRTVTKIYRKRDAIQANERAAQSAA